ncbi:MAG TPA: hypothetical protein VFI92_15715, partial [Steroidobacteraceae bacterium]|nr:hypothetical protein [Steroidobacteraceae bacterium]
ATPVGIDATQIHFTSHSIGAMTGAAHVKFSSATRTAVLANPGGPIALVAEESGRYGPIARSLVSRLVPVDTYNYNTVWRDVQAVVDAGDPYNHIKGAAARHPLLMFEVLGDGSIPNVSTDALIDAAGLTQVTTLGPNPVGDGAYTVFSDGNGHTTLLDWVNQPATLEMQMQAMYFAATATQPGGPFVTLTNPAVLDLGD